MTSRPTVLASAVLALALLGDSLLYAVLPLHAATFGISLAWTGVLLSVNRIVRLFLYSGLARIAARAGLRRFTIGVAALGGLSTLSFAAGSGGWPLLASRLAWGIAFGGLSLSVLAYATESRDGAGTRVGLSFSLRELGPVLSLTAGMLLVTTSGMRPALAILGATSMLAVPLAMRLPDPVIEASRAGRRSIRGVTGRETLAAAVGFVADGMFPATIALLLAPSAGVTRAAVVAGTLLAGKRAAVIFLSPISGRAAERFGERATTAAGAALTAAGAVGMICGAVVGGAVVLICGAAVTATSLPLAVTLRGTRERLQALARLGTARDAGAAAGPLAAMALWQLGQ